MFKSNTSLNLSYGFKSTLLTVRIMNRNRSALTGQFQRDSLADAYASTRHQGFSSKQRLHQIPCFLHTDTSRRERISTVGARFIAPVRAYHQRLDSGTGTPNPGPPGCDVFRSCYQRASISSPSEATATRSRDVLAPTCSTWTPLE